MTATLALAAYAPLLGAGVVAVWRRPLIALYAFVVGLAVHNLAMALLFGAGVQGGALTAIQAWKEILLATALAAVVVRARGLPFRPGAVDVLAFAFGGVVLLYAALPQSLLGGEAGLEGILYGLRHALLPVLAYLLGRSLALGREELVRIGYAVLAVAAFVAGFGIVEVYAVSLDWWRNSGAVGWYRDQLGFRYEGLSGLPENFAFNTGDETRPVRRLVSTFLSPLATAYLLAVALLFVAARPSPRTLALVPLLLPALLLTHSRSTFLALAGGLVVLALVRRRVWPAASAVAFVALAVVFVQAFPAIAPETRFTPEELEVQRRLAQERPGAVHDALDPREPSLASHRVSLRAGLETVASHPQGFGLGNAGSVAFRTGADVRAGESNYTELGVETGVAGLALFLAWNLTLLLALSRRGRELGVAAWLAATLATVLALGIQTDAFGVPWLALCVWGLCGAAVRPVPLRARVSQPVAADRSSAPGRVPG